MWYKKVIAKFRDNKSWLKEINYNIGIKKLVLRQDRWEGGDYKGKKDVIMLWGRGKLP